MIKSNIHINWYLWFSLMLFLLIFGAYMFGIKTIIYIIDKGVSFFNILIFILCFSLELFLLIVLKGFKYLIIDKSKNQLKYYSILRPFGKTLYFNDYIGTYQTTETGSLGSYKVLYLVDKNNITRLKIMGIYYKNMDEIMKIITLPKIRKNLSPKEYFKLLFIGKINLSEIENKKNVESKITTYLKIFITITFIIFILGTLIRIFG
ncbi:hypothetical protein NAL32_22110 [Chryseobacterium sp. Ch-15]|uniref:Uncharacterized protein n=1 Tax=Chryseobacterium muglaense TaxID=2893752 RepID=A0A9Q3UVM3_9FLAO|nr:hypothetical protein [Chryseobacterium muglaense]MBD3907366.1 hypothetical protein [Chryseobacterium muglaense]MCC9036523.1 hypothetical protein [Chryseobacterium muglaense]MCM2557080.1 hypothetical protein [Chryseobacterium muglaense]